MTNALFPADIGGRRHLNYASTILACIASLLVVAVYVIYFYGPNLRHRSPFAQSLANAATDNDGRRASYLPGHSGTSSSRRLSRANTGMSREMNSRKSSQADFVRRNSVPRMGSGVRQ